MRDCLAQDRTSLANERTILAYLRTAMMLLASGITLVKLFGPGAYLRVLGYLLVPVSIGVAIMGYVRFVRMRHQITRALPSPARDGLKPHP